MKELKTFENFAERINQKVMHNLMIDKCDTLINKCDKLIIEENKKLLKLLGDILVMNFLPHKVELKSIKKEKISKKMYFQEKENITFIRFTSNKIPKNIEYKSSIIYDMTKELGYKLPFWIIREYCLMRDKQKCRNNKYYNLDIFK
jgi:translation elongation factor EF-G